MAYCANCGKKAEDNARFCSNCGKPILSATNTQQPPPSPSAQGQQKSGWLRSFLVGTGFGVLVSNLFGHSSASASSKPSTTEQHHETVIYDHHNDNHDNHDYHYGNNYGEQDYGSDWDNDNTDSFDDYNDYNDYDSFDDGFDDSFDE